MLEQLNRASVCCHVHIVYLCIAVHRCNIKRVQLNMIGIEKKYNVTLGHVVYNYHSKSSWIYFLLTIYSIDYYDTKTGRPKLTWLDWQKVSVSVRLLQTTDLLAKFHHSMWCKRLWGKWNDRLSDNTHHPAFFIFFYLEPVWAIGQIAVEVRGACLAAS